MIIIIIIIIIIVMIIIITHFYSAILGVSATPLDKCAANNNFQFFIHAFSINFSVPSNKTVFTSFLKFSMFSSALTFEGRAFHSLGLAQLNVLPLFFVLNPLVSSIGLLLNLTFNFFEHWPCITLYTNIRISKTILESTFSQCKVFNVSVIDI